MSRWYDYLHPGDGAIDIGANIGSVAQKLAEQVGPRGRVLAVEPDPRNLCALNQIASRYPWIEVVPYAVLARIGQAQLYMGRESVHSSLWPANLLENDGEIALGAATTLDTLAARVPALKAIKIDTQGAEVEVLRGGSETLKRRGLVWYVEFWPTGLSNAGSSTEELARMFSEHGYHPEEKSWDGVLKETARLSGHGATDVTIVDRSR